MSKPMESGATPATREPTKAEREKAREIVAAHSTQFQREHIAGFRSIGEAIARALAAASDAMKERAAQLAESHVHKFSGLQIAAAIRAL